MDEWPVVAEHFGQWIVEDHFVNGQYLQTFKPKYGRGGS
jgi:mannitol-1-phosphate/altronate dehydrogenase